MIKVLSFLSTFLFLFLILVPHSHASSGTFDAVGKFTLQSDGTYNYDIDLSNFNPACDSPSPNGAIAPGFRIYDENIGGGIVSIDSIPVCASHVSGNISFRGFSIGDRIHFIYYDTHYSNNFWNSRSYVFSDLVTVPLDTTPPDITIQSP